MKIFVLLFLVIGLSASPIYTANDVPKKMSVKTKKERFFYLLAPAVEQVHKELQAEFESVSKDIKESKNIDKITKLKTKYRAKSDEDLLRRLKPHPQSIVLAQAAMESGWATSRFFVKANNVFGMWSSNKNEPRIAAGEKRGGTRTIWLRKFDSIDDSIRAYYRLMAMGRAFGEFRALRVKTDNPHELVKKLDKYSEIGAKYGEELSAVIRYNKLVKYDK